MTITVEVVHVVNGATHTHTYTADKASTQLLPGGGGNVVLTGGSDGQGPVSDVLYAHAEVMTRRPS